jgi:signal transduction histidine kinase
MLVTALVITFVACRGSSLMSIPEFALLDLWFRLRPPQVAHHDIALVGYRSQEVAHYERERRRLPDLAPCTCEVAPRDQIASLITRLKAAGAKVTALDLHLERPCPLHDKPLMKALEMPGETVVVTGTSPSPERFNFAYLSPNLAALKRPILASPVMYNPRGVIRGVRLIQRDQIETDSDNDLLPQISMVRPPLALACYAAYYGHSLELPEETGLGVVRCAEAQIPVWPCEGVFLLEPLMHQQQESDSKHAMLINWAGGIGTIPCYSALDCLTVSPEELKRRFTGRIVLIGSLRDRQHTPLAGTARKDSYPHVDQSDELTMSGLEVHANALDTVMQERFVQLVHPTLSWLLMVGLSLLTLALFRFVPLTQAVLTLVVMWGGLLAAGMMLLRSDLWLVTFTPGLVMVASAAIGGFWGYADTRQKAAQLAGQLRRRDEATSALVHDLKQPLAAINALAQVIRVQQQREGGLAATPGLIERIQSQVQVALGDIDELLTLDPARDIDLRSKEFDLMALVRDLAVAQGVRSEVHEVAVRGPEEGLMVEADPRYIARAVSNLLDNAIKYWPDGGTVLVEIMRGKGEIELRVSDQGIGIPPEELATLFEPFKRAVPRGMDISGTGIGLYSVRRIAEAHGGSVRVVSAQGVGSTFIIHLPQGLAESIAK